MSFHDDSHILSQLGILDSHERSPIREEKSFVDVKLTASVSDDDDDDEDMVFDRNNLLSSNKRQNASLIRGRADNQTIRFIILVILFLTAGLVSTSSTLSVCSVRHEVIACLWTCIGMFCGAWTTKLTSSRSNLMLYLFAVLLTLLVNLFFAFNFSFLFAIRGFFVGSTLYGGILIWFAFWRKQPRKLLILLFIFSTGGLLAMTVRTTAFTDATSSLADMSIVTRSIQNTVSRLKRAASSEDTEKTLLPFVDVDNATHQTVIPDDSVVKKPEVATGTVQKLKTKTEMNAEKEKEVEEKKKEEITVVDGTTGVNSTTDSTTTTTTTTVPTTTTSTTTTTTTTTTTVPPTTTEKKTTVDDRVDVKTRDSKEETRPSTSPLKVEEESPPYPANCPSDNLFLSGNVAEETTTSFLKTFASFGVIIYVISYILCCLPCGLKPDSKIKKLESDSVVGLGMRLRILVAAIQTIIGFLQQIKHFHSSSQSTAFSEHITICVFVMITSLIIVFVGRRIGSIEGLIISFVLTAFGEIILLFSSNSSQFGAIVSICGLYSLWISMFLVIEVFLQVRSTVQLAYFLIAWIVGRSIACLFSLEPVFSDLEHTFCVLFTISIGILLYYSVRMLQKSKRLKEILDNSSAPIPSMNSTSGPGEYISLTAQDVMDDDDLIDEEDENDRSSMDLDFELEQLGLEPVGVSSSSRA
uniref:DUF4203 domain-containing protein n=1 Tax=Caenorhabditis tropicalis TaxID=1561998 RepID=A0A1I7ULT3_9PELO